MTAERDDVDAQARDLLGRMSLNERLATMDGDLPFFAGLFELGARDYYHHKPFSGGANARLGIEGVQFIDGPRGIVLEGGATCFPVPMARGATFDPELEARVGDAIGKELRSHGGNLFGGVCINLLRHPAWGRAQETYGEDPLHLGLMGSGLVRGVERHGMACIKHFAANSMENARFHVDVTMRPRVLHEMYLPHFKACIDAGASVVMSAYNAVNGEWCGQNRALLTDVLRDRWGFDGFVITDFVFGLRDAERGALAGQDLEMPFRFIYRDRLRDAVEAGRVPASRIDEAVLRILRKLLALPPADAYGRELRACAEHTALAREVATKSIVLLKNEEGVLPLADSGRVAVIGSLADTPNLGDRGSSDGRPEYVVTPWAGLRAALGPRARHVPSDSIDEAVRAAREADVALVVVGYTHREEGELIAPPSIDAFIDRIPAPKGWRRGAKRRLWAKLVGGTSKPLMAIVRKVLASDSASFGAGGDRASLRLPPHHVALIRAVARANPRTVVAVMAGSAVVMSEWADEVAGIVMLWYPGMEGGHAFADIVTGAASPSGRLPFVVPQHERDLPHFDAEAHAVEYDLWHGYRKLARDGAAPAYPFGFGLSYSAFEYADAACEPSTGVSADATLSLSVTVTNVGSCAAAEVVQIYVSAPDSAVERAPRTLVGFARTHLEPGASQRVEVAVPMRRLAYFDEARDDFVVEATRYVLRVARHERDEGLVLTVDVAAP